ncbi:MMPL family transporter [Actinoplanes regularis]|uniref:Putative drug exporter of the RND superfamily n=1 Tax=Actinoplanes regularis TaxID=52697 RepID=A0A239A3S9_9ACTN|nr:MMPL family transporter [Actinoplanes regularis]GIE87140.1 putative membrane protein ActII-3 [Actinoplanes regularis]SNR89768.1 putative drug exporter of the RND superfamily [Actinoplanes regularis]
MRTGSFARLVCGRRTKWVVLALWIVVLVFAGSVAGKLGSVEKNDNASWLPGDAEATQVADLQKQFSPDDIVPAILVYERIGGITPADQQKAAADARAIAAVPGVTGQVAGPFPAEDKAALQVIAPIKVDADGWDKIADVVGQIKTISGTGENGLSIHLTGPAGVAADSASAFEGIDGTLLYTTLVVVAIILLITYRSPVLWLLPIITAGVALTSAQAVIYLLAKHAGLVVNAQSAGILTVLVFGAGTDYALLLVARYREELRRHPDRHEAMMFALHRAGPAIIASAATVAIGMSCLMLAEVNATSGLGPVAALGIVVGLLAMMTLLPALLVICGRWLFWPVRPRYGSPEPTATGLWARMGAWIARRPRTVWVTTAVALGAMALGLLQLNANGLSQQDTFTKEQPSLAGLEVLGRHFPAGQDDPVVVIAGSGQQDAVRSAFAAVPGISEVGDPEIRNGLVRLEGTLRSAPDSQAAEDTVTAVRAAVHPIAGADAKVGGTTAMTLDINEANKHDNRLIIPLVLLVVLAILALLLRALVAPVILIATVVLSFAAALGVSALVFRHVFGFGGEDTAFPLFVFVFLVALGIDYNIFLMTRVREEAREHGTHRGAVIGLAATGGVITSAGIVLAGTFAALGSLPLVAFAEIGFAVAFGVLLDTLIVRSVLVTALNLDVGRWMWWPSALTRHDPAADVPAPRRPTADRPAADHSGAGHSASDDPVAGRPA